MTALLLEMHIACVRAGYEIRMVSYTSKHASQSLSDKPFLDVTVFLDILLENFRSNVDVQHIERLLYYRRHSLCELELQ